MKGGLSLIIPAHNSEKVIETSLKEYNKVFSKKFKEFEIIVVCNACTDNTFKICKNLEPELPIKIINIIERGKGNALIKGFKQAKYDIIGFLDSDNPFDLEKISKMIDNLKNNDVVIVTKFLRGKIKQQEFLSRRIISLGGSIFTKIIFGFKFRDTQGGAKFFKRYVWEKINKNLICVGFDIDIEFLYKILKNKFKIAEVYIPLESEKFSTVRIKYLPGMVYRLIKLRLAL
jgi:glycosyltransferase involved in cell wall biosynthesis